MKTRIDEVAGDKMKETGTALWREPNSGATNESGLSVLPGGCRNLLGNYDYLGGRAYFWSSTEYYSDTAWIRNLDYNQSGVYRYAGDKRYGYSVRCVRN